MTKTVEQKCSTEGCKRPYRAKGYCDFHFKKWRNGELPHSPYKTCLESGCRKPRQASGRCVDHEKKAPAVPASVAAAPKAEAAKADEAPQEKAPAAAEVAPEQAPKTETAPA